MPLSIAAAMRVLLHRKSATTRNLGTQFSYAVKLTLCPRRVSRSSIFLTYAGLLCGKAPMIRDTIDWTLGISLRIILILFFHLCLCQKLSLLFRFPYYKSVSISSESIQKKINLSPTVVMPHELHFVMQYSTFLDLHFSASNVYCFIPANCYTPHTLNASPFFTPHYATVCGTATPSTYVSLTK